MSTDVRGYLRLNMFVAGFYLLPSILNLFLLYATAPAGSKERIAYSGRALNLAYSFDATVCIAPLQPINIFMSR